MTTLDGVALITGAGSGMGRACAVTFANAGAKVILVDLNEAGLKETKELLPKDTVSKIVVLNICNDDELIAFIQGIPQLEEFGRIDYALNCAGVLGKVRGKFMESELKDDDFIMNVNVRAQGIMIREELKVMTAQAPRPSAPGAIPKARGSIVNWASWVSDHGSPTSWAYSASKHAIKSMTKSAAIAHAADGIRCNAVAPGIMRTPLVPQAALERMVGLCPQGRVGEPSEEVVLFLCSDASSYVNGAIIPVDGAWGAA